MTKSFDVIVIGLGAMGSACLYQIAKSGKKVMGIDRFQSPHCFGTTHGESRLTRLAVGEGSVCTPLVLRSHEIWRVLEKETGRKLLTTTGGLIFGSGGQHNEASFVEKTIAIAKQYQVFDGSEPRCRYPNSMLTTNFQRISSSTQGFWIRRNV